MWQRELAMTVAVWLNDVDAPPENEDEVQDVIALHGTVLASRQRQLQFARKTPKTKVSRGTIFDKNKKKYGYNINISANL